MRQIGSVGVIAGTILSYLLVHVVPQSLIVRSVLRTSLRKNQGASEDEPIVVTAGIAGRTVFNP